MHRLGGSRRKATVRALQTEALERREKGASRVDVYDLRWAQSVVEELRLWK